MEGERHTDTRVQHIIGSRCVGESAPSRAMIGVDVGIYDEPDAHPRLVRDPQIWFDVVKWIHHSAGGVPAAAEQVRNRHGIGMEELTQNHAGPPAVGSRALTGDTRSIIFLIDP
jgi:hypothetical protein